MRTNGESEKKGRFSIIGIASGNVSPDLKKSAIIFRRDEYDSNEMRAVCESILKNTSEIPVNYFEMNIARNCQMYSQLEYHFKNLKNLLQEITFKDRKNQQNQEWSKIDISYEPGGSTLKVGDLIVQVPVKNANLARNLQEKLVTLTPSEQKLFYCLAANKLKRYPLIVRRNSIRKDIYSQIVCASNQQEISCYSCQR
ncbi:hypothetical protein TVAG_300620 [Trichomonas vaginalis G3]|uniref:Uncharacterized protein n=1 Tax=Trichomonas vaginalis (strain ATCC PRA-98 / G3) TaxID=412133 RepID=A2EP42_TRIV3|nr:nuclear chaperone required for maturation and nuclear export of pre-60s ribosome subunits [Trichomonas vaginalis G3]EAY05580.1 hypothetical protein TVAG_300620 [Trichomonas vaginalis G3]KAI5547516.1 nuclear chaperone required for maturation and nuclear export of pre-60s ribosome subunits [Trichomonas vaginalis G3]|eukprot:XP_001317803.1 hypothetical protein [Trichomonas vaginalis G3]